MSVEHAPPTDPTTPMDIAGMVASQLPPEMSSMDDVPPGIQEAVTVTETDEENVFEVRVRTRGGGLKIYNVFVEEQK